MITEGTNSPEWFVLSLSFVVAVLTQGQFSPQGALAVSTRMAELRHGIFDCHDLGK